MKRPMLFVIAYDVVSDRRRDRLHGLLVQFGLPVQKSVFEARLTPSERERLLARAARIIDSETDQLALYPIGASHEERIRTVGLSRDDVPVETSFVV